MNNTNTSENKEALVVLGESIVSSATTYLLASPLPIEIKTPLVTLLGSVATAIFVYWKQSINKPQPQPTTQA